MTRRVLRTKMERAAIVEHLAWLHGTTCRKCGCRMYLGPHARRIGQNYATIDHVVPLARGGEDSIENMQLLCYRCNREKGGRTEDYRQSP